MSHSYVFTKHAAKHHTHKQCTTLTVNN